MSHAQQQLEVATQNLRASEVAQSTAAEEAAVAQQAATALGVEVDAMRVRTCSN